MGLLGNAVLDDRESKYRQLERVIAHPILHGSETLCRLLRFLFRQAIEHPGTPLKEYQIATELLGRPADFDPRLDSSVRVQTGRLRAKLAEYYAGPGAADALVMEIPKGAYTLVCRTRAAAPRQPLRPARRWRLALAGALLAALGYAASAYWPPAGSSALDEFWRAFLRDPDPPLVVYSNAAFVGRPDHGMRYYDPRADGEQPVLDHYTGVGEVMAVHALDRVFARFGRPPRVKRARLLTWDEAKTSSLIFIGSTAENASLRELPERDFVFTKSERGEVRIVNRRPRPGEAPLYQATPTLPITEDYALVSLLPGAHPSRRVLILAGTTTLGTQAAGEFVSDPVQLAALRSRLGRFVPFEAVLRVKVSGGVPVESELVAVHSEPRPSGSGD